DRLWRQGSAGGCQCPGLAVQVLQFTMDSVLMFQAIRNCRLSAAFLTALLLNVMLAGIATPARADRIQDIATVSGVRGNQLFGSGILVGLDGTGDQTTQAPFTIQSIANMLAKFGVTIPAGSNPQLKNVAAVTVTADLPPFSKAGQTIDVTVASI